MPFMKQPVDGMGNTMGMLVYTKLFLSAEQTGNGSPQNVAHGLGGVPSIIAVFQTGDGRGTYNIDGTLPVTIVEGAHTSTNVVVTVTEFVKYRALALAIA